MGNRDPFAEGKDAFLAGQSETANPYDDQSDDFASWNDGWNEGAQEAEEDE